ncbi:MAG: hypothetical protein Q9202_007303 [Teloschistes flavicans]
MLHYLLVLAPLFAIISASPTPTTNEITPRYQQPAYVASPGPIPFADPGRGGWPAVYSVDQTWSGTDYPKDDITTATFEHCLVDYGSNQFYNSWQGNICGGLGWFKGGSGISQYDCYQICATYLLYAGARLGRHEYMCEFRRKIHDKCWMGYHRLPYTALQDTNGVYAAES